MFSEENDGGDQINHPEELVRLKLARTFSTGVIPILKENVISPELYAETNL